MRLTYPTPTTETFFEGVKRLDAGNYLIYKDGQINIERYFDLTFPIEEKDYDKTVEEIGKVMEDSTRHQ